MSYPNFRFEKILVELIDVRRNRSIMSGNMKELLSREKELKQQITEYVKQHGTVTIGSSRIEFKVNFIKRTLQREPTLDFIRSKYGDDVADDVDKNCTKLNESEGLWFYHGKGDVSSDALDSLADILIEISDIENNSNINDNNNFGGK